ncbi:hypothetical protein GOP47_0005781 [Adiantum capillus-veneris]|uniref:Uncharacterized protein n=1 Tax=Adiantum capillus-veneris TaxID=13818 RepID=A0A9D4ZNK6_ADICA|nr:hypothetical protein GOP47_0005781 [Adiantum capillus-veneris]
MASSSINQEHTGILIGANQMSIGVFGRHLACSLLFCYFKQTNTFFPFYLCEGIPGAHRVFFINATQMSTLQCEVDMIYNICTETSSVQAKHWHNPKIWLLLEMRKKIHKYVCYLRSLHFWEFKATELWDKRIRRIKDLT